MELLTNSAVKSYRACPRLYQIRYELGYKSIKDASALAFGTAMHAGLEVWMATHDLVVALAAIMCESLFDQVKVEELLRGYHFMWMDSEWATLAIEQQFRAPLVNPKTGAPSKTWQLGGKLDALITDSQGQHWIMEHKTSSEDIGAGSDYWKRLQLDSQVSTYFVGARTLGIEPAGCLYDVIKKPTIRPAKATPAESRKFTKDGRLYANMRAEDETPEEFRIRLREDIASNPEKYYQRGTVTRLDDDERDAAADAWATAKAIREAQLSQRWPRNPDACVRWGRTCDYFPICTRCESLDNPTLYRKVEPHEELNQPVEPQKEVV